MMNTENSHQSKGNYLGTVIDAKWWKRYKKDKLFARGNGKYWYDETTFYFLRYLTKQPIQIPWNKIVGFEIGKSHAGRWVFKEIVLKILWEKDGMSLSSGFIVARDSQETKVVMAALKRLIA
jgi:hypothetical protein